MAIVKAISIRQPWAWCIVKGLKPVENRTWATKFRGRVLIHAGKKFDREGYQWLLEHDLIPANMEKSHFELGGFVGSVDVVDCVESMDSIWFFGPKGFVLENAEEQPFQSARGQLGFFSVDTSTFSY